MRSSGFVLFVHHDWSLVKAIATDTALQRDFEVIVATNAVEAIEQIMALQRIECLVLSSELPGLDSAVTAATFRQLRAGVPIFMMNGGNMVSETSSPRTILNHFLSQVGSRPANFHN